MDEEDDPSWKSPLPFRCHNMFVELAPLALESHESIGCPLEMSLGALLGWAEWLMSTSDDAQNGS